MTGGKAYVWDPDSLMASRCNAKSVRLVRSERTDEDSPLLSLVERHHQLTRSAVADRLLQDWDQARLQFVEILPITSAPPANAP
jgi:glutamate synthase (ferredoxin)